MHVFQTNRQYVQIHSALLHTGSARILLLQMLADTQADYRLRDGWAWFVSQPELTNDSWVSSGTWQLTLPTCRLKWIGGVSLEMQADSLLSDKASACARRVYSSKRSNYRLGTKTQIKTIMREVIAILYVCIKQLSWCYFWIAPDTPYNLQLQSHAPYK